MGYLSIQLSSALRRQQRSVGGGFVSTLSSSSSLPWSSSSFIPYTASSSVIPRNHAFSAYSKRYNATAFGKTYSEKNTIVHAYKQIQTVPEYQQVDTTVPWGRPLKENLSGNSHNNSSSGSSNSTGVNIDILNRQAMANLDRVNDILKYIVPPSSNPSSSSPSSLSPFAQAVLRRRCAVAESTEDFTGGEKAINTLEKYYLSVIGKGKDGLDAASGHERANAAESLLVIARYTLASLSSAQSTSTTQIQAIDDLLDIAIHVAGTNIDDLSNISNNDINILASSLPAAITSARSHSLKILTTRLQNKVTLPPDAAKAAEEAFKTEITKQASKDGKGGPKPGTEDTKPSRPPTLQEGHLQVVLNTCDTIDMFITSTVDFSTGEKAKATAQAARYVHGRTAMIRAVARRNLAACYLLDAVQALTQQGTGSTTSEAINTFGASDTALSHISAAHEQLTAALEQVNTAVIRFRDMNENARKENSPLPTTVCNAWRRLGWDLRLQRADITAVNADVGLLLALWTAWQGIGVPNSTSTSTVSKSSSSSGTSLFPLTAEQFESVAPVLRTVSTAAESALHEYEAIKAAYANTSNDEYVTLSDYGIDYGQSYSKPLVTIGLLQFISGKAVTAEGIFRTVQETYERIHVSHPNIPGNIKNIQPTSLDQHYQKWEKLPLWYLNNISNILYSYSTLLAQWDKREKESIIMRNYACSLTETCIRSLGGIGLDIQKVNLSSSLPTLDDLNKINPSAGKSTGGSSTTTTTDRGSSSTGGGTLSQGTLIRQQFLVLKTFIAAMNSMHIGSWGFGVPKDLSEI